jgi:hypothetical protein
VLALPSLHNPFDVERDASGYAMGVILIQGRRPILYHFEVFHGEIINYPTYENELYDLVQTKKNWKHYLMGKETIIHTDHQSL